MKELKLIDFSDIPNELEHKLNRCRKLGVSYGRVINYLVLDGWYISQKQWDCYMGLFEEQVRLDLVGIDYNEVYMFTGEREYKS